MSRTTMTSASTFPKRLTKVDDLTRADHYHLAGDDDCYFLGEYSARKGFAFSPSNALILNFKKKMDRRGRPEWVYKAKAIQNAAEAFRAAFKNDIRKRFTFVPVPPSKARSDPLYDDRLLRMLAQIWPNEEADIREIVLQPLSTDAVHDQEQRPTPSEIEARYVVDRQTLTPAPSLIAVVDDVLTTGAHFVAVRNKLRQVFPDARIVGIFIARRVPETIDFEAFEDL